MYCKATGQPLSAGQTLRAGQTLSAGQTLRAGQTLSAGANIESRGKHWEHGKPLRAGQTLSAGVTNESMGKHWEQGQHLRTGTIIESRVNHWVHSKGTIGLSSQMWDTKVTRLKRTTTLEHWLYDSMIYLNIMLLLPYKFHRKSIHMTTGSHLKFVNLTWGCSKRS